MDTEFLKRLDMLTAKDRKIRVNPCAKRPWDPCHVLIFDPDES